MNVKISYESWRKNRHRIEGKESPSVWGLGETSFAKDCSGEIFQEPDTILSGNNGQIFCCHHNKYSIWENNLEIQALGGFEKISTDPLLHLNYGLMIQSLGLVNKSDTLLVSQKAATHFQINVYPLTQNGSIDSWKNMVLKNEADIKKISLKSREEAHLRWWKQFWNRSYICINSKDSAYNKQAEIVTQGYILQRFINACSGRGKMPIKFNGSIFTVDTYNRKDERAGLNADFRMWGGCYWFQNTRLPYWTMLISGDFDMMNPLFQMYFNSLSIRKFATKRYYNHEGAFYPETINFWGTYANGDYGCNRKGLPDGYVINPYIRFYWQGGLELSLMMLDYYSFTCNNGFARDTLVPFVSEILSFFNQHWKRGKDGKILFSPAQSLETFHTAVNPLPEIVGIRIVSEKMLTLPKAFSTEKQRLEWEQLKNDLPEIPIMLVDKKNIIAPASEFSDEANVENPELYAIFPYRAFCIGKPNLELARHTFAERNHKENGGWQQNSIQSACLGLSDEAKKMVIESFSIRDSNMRFPAFWGPNFDWTPDQDHGNVAVNALQRMIIQYEGNKVFLFPAWPKEWNVRFKVNAPYNTTIEGSYVNGKIDKLKVTPERRKKDVFCLSN